MASRIEDYALIGDCHTAALVSRDGSIDWMCLPRFDSGAVFAALLQELRNMAGGKLRQPRPQKEIHAENIEKHADPRETEFETGHGAALLTDFMPWRGKHPRLIRMVRGLRGKVEMAMDLVLRFDYGHLIPWVMRVENGALRGIAGPHMVVLHTPAEVRGENSRRAWGNLQSKRVKQLGSVCLTKRRT